MELNWTEPALVDLDDIYQFIADDSPENASGFILRLVDSVTRLQTQPHSGRFVPEAGDTAIREIVYQNYRILYWIPNEARVDVLAVVHASREMSRLAQSIAKARISGKD
jgi:plasmid stabilization system protein ParE